MDEIIVVYLICLRCVFVHQVYLEVILGYTCIQSFSNWVWWFKEK